MELARRLGLKTTPDNTFYDAVKRLGVPGEEDFIGAGVRFCATCDGAFYRGQEVLVIGGGNSAVEEGVFLTRYAGKVTILVRGDQLTASADAIEKAIQDPKIIIRYQSESPHS